MKSRVTPYARLAGIVAAALFAVATTAGTVHAAPPAAEPPSTPVPVTMVPGAMYAYVLNVKNVNPGQMMLAENAVKDAGGVVVQAWPEIGVVVAHSSRATFEADVLKMVKGNAVTSIGMTRTVPVKEGTPDNGKTTPGAQGKGQQALDDVVPDPLEASQQWNMAMIGAQAAHNITDGSPDVLVGVLDSGIDPTNPELADQIDRADSVNCTMAGAPDTSPTGWYPTASTHGTHVAGIIAAARNGAGIVGVAPGVKLASIKVGNDDGFIYPEYAICGFVWAAEHGVDVTNNSYYIDPFEYWCSDQPDQAAVKEAVIRAVNFATANGVISVVAAGNSSQDLANKLSFLDKGSPDDAVTPTSRVINSQCIDIPNELDGTVSVSALTSTGALASYSNRGLGKIDVAAPGSSIYSTVSPLLTGANYGRMSGTSMASPHVAGVLALMKSAHPSWTPAQMLTALRTEATPKPCPANAIGGAACVGTDDLNSYYGYGVVNALAAVQP